MRSLLLIRVVKDSSAIAIEIRNHKNISKVLPFEFFIPSESRFRS